ncbi:MAG: iron-sulfur cluster assembly accessory protein [Caldilineaceae bacterium]|nr:iron-sulfur cluster assembly accessory protein [Caldilineaceae bacterium]
MEGVTLTENAAEKLGGLMEQKGMKETHALRVFVKGGGCGGMQYGMTFDDNFGDGDEVYNQPGGLRVVVDATSLFYVAGANIDYVENLMGGGFHIDNPNAVSSCGCGSSFRTAQSHNGEETANSCGC